MTPGEGVLLDLLSCWLGVQHYANCDGKTAPDSAAYSGFYTTPRCEEVPVIVLSTGNAVTALVFNPEPQVNASAPNREWT